MRKVYLFFVVAMLNVSCSLDTYYQMYNSVAENGKVLNNEVVFEDQNCVVSYDLFSDGGKVGFSVFNKTESDITIDLTKTFFVLNNTSNEYYQNRLFSKSGNTVTSTSSYLTKTAVTNTSSSSVTYHEKPQLTIPSHTRVHIAEFSVVQKRFVSCDLVKYPASKSIKTLQYKKDNSPFQFYNLISYTVNNVPYRFDNRFYVSEIANYPAKDVFNVTDRNECNNVLDYSIKTFKLFQSLF